LGLAIGDALGATVEFMTPSEIKTKYGIHRRIIGAGWLHLRPGQVTDDTEMSLALGQAVLDAEAFDAVVIAQAFSDWMRQKPVDIGNTVRRGVMHFRQTGRPSISPAEDNAGNGACMRCLPVALASLGAPPEEVVRASRIQTHITHHNALADAGTECVVQMVQAALQGADMTVLQGLAQRLVDNFPAYAFQGMQRDYPSAYIVETLQAVFQALFANAGFESAMLDVVNRGGDADTTGAILGMIAGAFYGIEQIPLEWRNALDAQIAERCDRQAVELLRLAPCPVVTHLSSAG